MGSSDRASKPQSGKYPFYIVVKGRRPEVYSSWAACQAQGHGYSGDAFMGVHDIEEGYAFIASLRTDWELDASIVVMDTTPPPSDEINDTNGPLLPDTPPPTVELLSRREGLNFVLLILCGGWVFSPNL
ncbi:hypothetical protein QJS10_CPB15g00910 [Acorus calamus]|uniref:Ribonuclease H1 N-terminal domain-containing protein n=1 Tax=Acorus calamus TaxID=4465 RepID=A0AAV9D7M7_ACOCL|nr:hypothetical protein QJS10_CPB15g00910 [Acorus calamus]